MPKQAPTEFRQMATRHNARIKLWIEQGADETVSTEQERLKKIAIAKLGLVDRIRASLVGFQAPDAGLCAAITYAWVLANLRGEGKKYRMEFDSGKIPERFVGSQQALQVKNTRYVTHEKEKSTREMGMYGAVLKQLQSRSEELERQAKLPGTNPRALHDEIAEITDRMNRLGSLITTSRQDYGQQNIDAYGPVAEDALTSTPIFTARTPGDWSTFFASVVDYVWKKEGFYTLSIRNAKGSKHVVGLACQLTLTSLMEIRDDGEIAKVRFLDANSGEWRFGSSSSAQRFLVEYFSAIYPEYVQKPAILRQHGLK